MEHSIKKRIIIRYNEQQELKSNIDLAHDLFMCWLQTYDDRYTLYSHKDVFKTVIHTCTEHLAHLLTLFSCKTMYLPVIYYCDLYLQQKRSISVGNLLQLLFVSSIVTMKFWDEEHVDDINLVVSKLSSVPLNTLMKMEIEMLQTIDYKLLIDDEKMRNFKEEIKNNYTHNKNKYYSRMSGGVAVAVVRKRMRLMDDIDYYKHYTNTTSYISNNYENKRVKICE